MSFSIRFCHLTNFDGWPGQHNAFPTMAATPVSFHSLVHNPPSTSYLFADTSLFNSPALPRDTALGPANPKYISSRRTSTAVPVGGGFDFVGDVNMQGPSHGSTKPSTRASMYAKIPAPSGSSPDTIKELTPRHAKPVSLDEVLYATEDKEQEANDLMQDQLVRSGWLSKRGKRKVWTNSVFNRLLLLTNNYRHGKNDGLSSVPLSSCTTRTRKSTSQRGLSTRATSWRWL